MSSTKEPVIRPHPLARKHQNLTPRPEMLREFLASHSPEGGGAELLPWNPAAQSRSLAEPC